MRTLVRALVALNVLIVFPTTAHAHLVSSGIGPFYDGGLHLLLSPADLLGLIAAALLIGLQGRETARRTVLVMPIAWLAGGLLGMYVFTVPAIEGLGIGFLILLGLLVATDIKLPASLVMFLLGVFGLAQGLLGSPALLGTNQNLVTLLGIATSVFVVALLLSVVVISLRPVWTRIAVRVAGSWIVAVGLLMLGWMLRSAV